MLCQPQTQDVSSNADGEADPEILGETDGWKDGTEGATSWEQAGTLWLSSQ